MTPDLEAAFDLAYYTPLQQHRSGADTKAGALLTGCGLMFSILASASPELREMMAMGSIIRVQTLGLGAVFALLALGTVVQAFKTISPRFPPAPPSLAFFGDIARLSQEEYIQRVEGLSQEGALHELLLYNHTLSSICVDKFADLDRAIRFFRAAFLCWLSLMALLTARSLLL